MGNEQCRQEIKERERGRGKGLKSAEVGRPPATCPAAEDGAGELEADGGNVTQSPSPPPFLPPSFLCRNAFLSPCFTHLPRPPPPFLIPLPYLLHFSHNERFRRLTDALAQNDRISFTSSAAENYQRKRSGGFSAVSLSWHIPRPRNNYARASFGGKERVARYILNFERSQKKHYRRQRYTQSQIKVRCGTRGTEFCLTQ